MQSFKKLHTTNGVEFSIVLGVGDTVTDYIVTADGYEDKGEFPNEDTEKYLYQIEDKAREYADSKKVGTNIKSIYGCGYKLI